MFVLLAWAGNFHTIIMLDYILNIEKGEGGGVLGKEIKKVKPSNVLKQNYKRNAILHLATSVKTKVTFN